jgi:hypothetical protein
MMIQATKQAITPISMERRVSSTLRIRIRFESVSSSYPIPSHSARELLRFRAVYPFHEGEEWITRIEYYK